MASQNKRLEITITGDEKDAVRALRALSGETDKADKQTGKLSGGMDKLGISSGMVFGGLAAGAAAGAYALYEVGSSFDAVFDGFRVATGKTGEDLAALEDSFREVFASGPDAAEDVGAAMTKLSVGLGLTGESLEGVSKQLLDLARITDADVVATVDGATKALQNFAVPAEEQAEVLDQLFRVTQATGISFEELTAQLGDNGLALRSAGLDIEESAAFLGTLKKAGIDSTGVMSSLTKSLTKSAKAGVDAETALKNTFAAIALAPDQVAAADIAVQMFGKSGVAMATAIREGKLSYDELLASMQSGTTIEDEAAATADFSEKWETFKNKMLVAFEPAATAAFEKLGEAMDWLTVEGIPRFQSGWEKFTNGIQVISTWLDPWVANFQLGWRNLADDFGRFVDRFQDGWNRITNKLTEMRDNWNHAVQQWKDGFSAIGNFMTEFNANFYRGVDMIRGGVDSVVSFITGIPGRIWGVGASIATAISDGFKAAWNTVADTVNGVIPDSIPLPFGRSVGLPANPLPKFHSGGVVPGRPGQEVPAILQAGEVVYTAAQAARGGGGGVSVVVNMGIVGDASEAGRQVVSVIERYLDGGGSARFAA